MIEKTLISSGTFLTLISLWRCRYFRIFVYESGDELFSIDDDEVRVQFPSS